jgi:hypothetical protein
VSEHDRHLRSFTSWHAPDCKCEQCVEDLRAQRITTDAPTASLPSNSVSLRELVDNATHTQPRYSIGEDWNDD